MKFQDIRSNVITKRVLVIDLIIGYLSNGFKNLAFITSALIFIFFNFLQTFMALLTWFPIATIVTSFPNVKKSHFLYCIRL